MAKDMLCFVLLTVAVQLCYSFVANYDDYFNFNCAGLYQTISEIQSVHDDKSEDRIFDFDCKDVPGNPKGTRRCVYSHYWENNYDELLLFQCPGNMYIVGMTSKHDNGPEDRRWKFNCCGFNNLELYDCRYTGWTNGFDKAQDFRVPGGYVIKGVISVHDNGPEDRLYRYHICRVRQA